MNHKKKNLINFLKTRAFWSNSEKEQIVVTFKKCFTLSRRSTSWICFNNDINTAIQCLKKWKSHDSASHKFKNCKNWYHSNSETLSLQEYDCHVLFTELQFLTDLFREKACQNMLSDQQKNSVSLLKCEIYHRKFDYAHHSTRRFQIQHNKHLFFVFWKLQSCEWQLLNSSSSENSKLIKWTYFNR